MGVVLISSGLIIGLLQEARAVTIEFASDSVSTVSSSVTYTVDVTVPSGQRVPINEIAAVVEQQRSGASDKSGASVVARAVCTMAVMESGNCPDNGAFALREGERSTAITKIAFTAAYKISVASGYQLTDTTLYYGYGTLSGTRTGYGYDTVSDAFSQGFGYGYGHTLGTGQTSFSIGSGNGYGYSGQDLILRYQITVNPQLLATGKHYLTVVALTGSSVIGDLSSRFFEFTVTAGGGGSGGGSGGDGGNGGTGGQTITVAATSITPPEGAHSAYQATIAAANAGDIVVIDLPGNVPDIRLTLSTALTGVTATIAMYDGVPSGSVALPAGVVSNEFIVITLTGASGEVGTIAIPVVLDALPDGAEPDQGVLLREENGAWVPHGRMEFVQGTDGKWTATGTAPCCSVFAVAFDTQAPTVALTVPTETVTGAATITADAQDNLQRITKVEFYVDGNLASTDDAAPFEYAFDGAAVSAGEHTIRAVATDFVGNTGEDSKTVMTEGGTDGGPGPGDGKKGGVPGWVWFLIIVLVIALIIGAVVMSGKKK